MCGRHFTKFASYDGPDFNTALLSGNDGCRGFARVPGASLVQVVVDMLSTVSGLRSNRSEDASDVVTYSLVVPVYRNEENIPSLVAAVENLSLSLGGRLEAVFVIDGSPDASGEVLLRLLERTDLIYNVVFHSRNFGSFTAIRTGLEQATGSFFAVMAADLQEPPELVEKFFDVLAKDEADIVFGQRVTRADSKIRDALSHIFWWMFRNIVMRDMPKGGVDIFGCNRDARAALLSIGEPNSSLVAQLFWIGFRRSFVPYSRRPRLIGTSAWGFSRRVRYMMDSILSFSDLPLLMILWAGLVGVIVSAFFAIVSVGGRLLGLINIEGYTTLVLLISFFGSSILLGNGLIGCYVWRTFENTKQRPLGIVSRVVKRRPHVPDIDK